MAVIMPKDDYGTYGSVPTAEPEGPRRVEPRLNVESNQNQFGAQIGGALEKVGDIGEKASDQEFQYAMKQQGLINETAASGAEIQLINANAKAKADFYSKEGTEAYNALPAYQKTLDDNYNNLRATLPAGALRQFDMLGLKQNANYNSDATMYATTQLKKQQMMNASSLIDAHQAMASNPDINAYQVGQLLGTSTHLHGTMLDENDPGLTQDENGQFSYADNSAGQALKATTQSSIENSHGIIWQNAISAKAEQNPLDAQQFYQENKDSIPPMAQARIESFLNPKVDNYKADGIVNTSMVMGRQQYRQDLLNPSSSGSNPNNLGNVKTAEGAANGTANFINPATPTDGVIATANNLRSNYQGLTLEQIASKWTGENPQKVSDWVKNASAASGIAPNATPNLSNPAELSSLLKGIATAEKSPADRAAFTDDVIGQGVTASLNGKQASLLPAPVGKNYATNPDGSKMSDADWFSTHRDQVLAWGSQMAERDFPGNPTYRSMVEERLKSQMDAAISSQNAQYKQDNQFVTKAIFGDLSKGNPPATYQELRALPGVGPVLDRIYSQDPKFAEGIDTMIARANRGVDTHNSPNGYDTILRTLTPLKDSEGNSTEESVNAIKDQQQLDSLLGKSDGTGINMKDYTDAKKALGISNDIKSYIGNQMKLITGANGNLDQQGQSRALNWYSQTAKIIEQNNSLPAEKKLSDSDLLEKIEGTEQIHMPSSMEQFSNWAKRLVSGTPAKAPTFASPNDPGFSALPSGAQFMTPDGQMRTKK